MEAGGQSEIPAQCPPAAAVATNVPFRTTNRFPLRARDVQIYRGCEYLTGGVICCMAVFGPWAFGTTQPWSIWTMNLGGYFLGLLLALKLAIRRSKGYRHQCWVQEPPASLAGSRGAALLMPARLTVILAFLNFAILAYCLTSALNARATYFPSQRSFEYHDCVTWLPHSFDSRSTWFAFWTYLGLTCSFWAGRDWLLGKSEAEDHAQWRKPALVVAAAFSAPIPARLRWLLWLLAINGALLGVECIVQRLENSPKLLFLVKPRIHQMALGQFGPYAYQSNAAQYFNLLWPVCLGFWWSLNRAAEPGRKTHHLLLLCGAIMAACPIISSSRGGALVSVGIAVLGAFFLVTTHFLLAARKQESKSARRLTLCALAIFFAAALAAGFALGWKTLKPRMAQIDEGFEGRQAICEVAGAIARDYPVFGTGPGTYESVSELYRPPGKPVDSFWTAQVHNDWLETRITFGWVGSLLVGLALLTVLLRWFARGGIHGGRRFVTLTWLALAGCLAHARFDFPFQIHSIVFLFVVLCAVLFNLSRRP